MGGSDLTREGALPSARSGGRGGGGRDGGLAGGSWRQAAGSRKEAVGSPMTDCATAMMVDLKRCDSFFYCINLSVKICAVDECWMNG